MKARVVAPLVVTVLAAAACSGDDTSSPTTVAPTTVAATSSVRATSTVATTASDSVVAESTSTSVAGPSGPGCGGVESAPDALVPAAVTATAELSTLAEALGATGLDGVLGDDGPFTVLAPVDSAFEAVADLDALLADPAQLTALLALHVVDEQRLEAADLSTVGTVPSLGGELSFTQDGEALVVNGTATVVCADIQTANATVHLIDTVLTAPVDEEVVTGSELFSVDLATGAATSLGAIGTELGVLGLAYAPADSGQVYGLTDAAELITFDPADPAAVLSTTPITGVGPASTLITLEAAEGLLYAVSDASVLYSIDPATGVATQLGTGINPPLTEPAVGFVITPQPLTARLWSASGGILLLDLGTGTVPVDPATEEPLVDPPFSEPEQPTPARIVAVASPTPPADGVGLYGVDAASGNLVGVETPETGVLRTIGPLGITVTDGASFDIGPDGIALLVVPG